MLDKLLFEWGMGAVVTLVALVTLRWHSGLRDLVKPLENETGGKSSMDGRVVEWAGGQPGTTRLVATFLAEVEKGDAEYHYVGLVCRCRMAETYLVARLVKNCDWIRRGKGFVASCRGIVKSALGAGMAYSFALVYLLGYAHGREKPSFMASENAWLALCGAFFLATLLVAIMTAAPLVGAFTAKWAGKALE